MPYPGQLGSVILETSCPGDQGEGEEGQDPLQASRQNVLVVKDQSSVALPLEGMASQQDVRPRGPTPGGQEDMMSRGRPFPYPSTAGLVLTVSGELSRDPPLFWWRQELGTHLSVLGQGRRGEGAGRAQ